MANINLDINYFENIKTKRLIARRQKVSALVPIRLWCYAAKNPHLNGCLLGYTLEEYRLLLDWTSNVERLLSDLVAVGFLEKLDSGKNDYKIHDWESHQGHILAFSQRGKVANEKRWNKIREDKKEYEQKKYTGGVNATPL